MCVCVEGEGFRRCGEGGGGWGEGGVYTRECVCVLPVHCAVGIHT